MNETDSSSIARFDSPDLDNMYDPHREINQFFSRFALLPPPLPLLPPRRVSDLGLPGDDEWEKRVRWNSRCNLDADARKSKPAYSAAASRERQIARRKLTRVITASSSRRLHGGASWPDSLQTLTYTRAREGWTHTMPRELDESGKNASGSAESSRVTLLHNNNHV